VPSAFLIGNSVGLSFERQIVLAVWIFFIVIAFVWATISFSALFPVFDSKVLQKSSSLSGKFLAALVMSAAIPAKGTDVQSLYSAINFIFLAYLLRIKAVESLRSRLDPEQLLTPEFRLIDGLIIIFAVGAIHASFSAASQSVSQNETLSIMAWFLARIFSSLVFAKTTWSYASKRFEVPFAALSLTRCHYGKVLLGFGLGISLTIPASWYFQSMREFQDFFASTFQIWKGLSELLGSYWAGVSICFSLCILIPLSEELFFRGFFDKSLLRAGFSGTGGILLNGCLFAVNQPLSSFPVVFLLGIINTYLCRLSGSLLPAIASHALYNFGFLIICRQTFSTF